MKNLEFPTLPTIEQLQNTTPDVRTAIGILQDYRVYPIKPTKPLSVMFPKMTSAELHEKANELANWEKAMEEYADQAAQCTLHNMKVDELINEYISIESGLRNIPEQYQNKVFSKAWADGHSNGYYEVYGHLCELVDIFK